MRFMNKNGCHITDVVLNRVKVKVKFNLEQATKDLGGSRGVALFFP